jgi:hypothetical protein
VIWVCDDTTLAFPRVAIRVRRISIVVRSQSTIRQETRVTRAANEDGRGDYSHTFVPIAQGLGSILGGDRDCERTTILIRLTRIATLGNARVVSSQTQITILARLRCFWSNKLDRLKPSLRRSSHLIPRTSGDGIKML